MAHAKRTTLQNVSIRAPARGATGVHLVSKAEQAFRSALPRGERRGRLLPEAREGCFDPRSRAGSDVSAPFSQTCLLSFDPRSRAGSDEIRQKLLRLDKRFDPRSRAGSDPPASRTASAVPCFDPRSRAGSD